MVATGNVIIGGLGVSPLSDEQSWAFLRTTDHRNEKLLKTKRSY